MNQCLEHRIRALELLVDTVNCNLMPKPQIELSINDIHNILNNEIDIRKELRNFIFDKLLPIITELKTDLNALTNKVNGLLKTEEIRWGSGYAEMKKMPICKRCDGNGRTWK